ncbi:MAG: M23 family metallopeptidase [Mycobacteriales bacterium]
MSPRSIIRLSLIALVAAGMAVPAASAALAATAPSAPGTSKAAATPSRTGESAVRLGGSQSQFQSVDPPASTAKVVVPMVFPVVGTTSYSDTFLACRGTGCTRRHLGQDLMGAKLSPLVAVFSGTVSYIQRETTPGDGNIVSVTSYDGLWTVNYLHVNNDNPGTDDGKGTGSYAFLPGLQRGSLVARGQLLGWRGDSGNAESTAPHLHFELRRGTDPWSGVVYNPIYSLNAAPRLSAPLTAAPHQEGELIRWTPTGPVMLVTADGRRAVPASMMPVYAWTDDDVVLVTYDEVIRYPYRGIAPLMPGSIVSAGGTYWAITGGMRYSVTASDLTALGLPTTSAVPVTDEALLGTPEGYGAVPGGFYREGAIVHEYGNAQMYRMDHGLRRPIHQGTWLQWHIPGARVGTVPVGTFGQAGAPAEGAVITYKDGSIYRTTTQGTFMLVNGIRREIKDPRAQTYYNWQDKRQFWLYESVSATLPLGAPIA